jgi:hypothetical protein
VGVWAGALRVPTEPGHRTVRWWQTYGLASCRFRAHISGMAAIVQCNCGAEYRRTEEKFLAPHTGDAVCTVCGAALESWLESTHVPSYELIERPERPDRKPGRPA